MTSTTADQIRDLGSRWIDATESHHAERCRASSRDRFPRTGWIATVEA